MVSINPIIKLSIYIFAVILVGAAAVFFLKAKVESSAHKIYEKRSMLAALEFRENNSLVLSASYPVVRDNLPLLKKALPDKDNIADAVNAIDSLALETGNAQVLEFKPLAEPAGSASIIESLSFSAVLTGNIWSFGEYLNKIGKLPYFIEITSASVSGDTGITGIGGRMSLTAKLYIRK